MLLLHKVPAADMTARQLTEIVCPPLPKKSPYSLLMVGAAHDSCSELPRKADSVHEITVGTHDLFRL